jgi:hypothetical protein
MAEQRAFVMLYSTRIPIAGWGSAALVGIAALIVLAVPEARVLTLAGLAGGAALAALLIRRRARTSGAAHDDGLIHLSS